MRWISLALLLTATATAAASTAEEPVRVTGRIDGTTARLSARFSLRVTAGKWPTEHVRLALPRGGTVTAARATLGGASHPLALTAADAATAMFTALAADELRPGAKRSAVLIEGGAESVSVSIASARTGTVVLDLEVAVPTCYHRELRYIAVPNGWATVGGAVADKRMDGAAVEEACGALAQDASSWVAFVDRRIAKRPSGDRIGVTADRIDLGDDSLVRVEVDLANVLADVPRDLATVLVVDGSRSLSNDEREAQRDLARAYLASAPGSRVQVVAFARYARPLLPTWMPATTARSAVDTALQALVPENGSNLDVGLGEASRWLARITGTKRIVLITDQRLAKRLGDLPAEALKQAIPPGTLVHVVVATGSDPRLTRTDDAKLAPLASATEGMLVTAGPATPDRALDATSLVRPTSLDQMTISTPGWTQLSVEAHGDACADELSFAGGTACTWWGQSTRAAARPITIGGKLWGKAFTRVVTPSLARAVDVARELSRRGGLAGELHDAIVDRARAVNAAWSLYVAWGGAGTYETSGGGTGYGATCDCGTFGTIGHGSGTGSAAHLSSTPQIDLGRQLASELEACRLGAERVDVEVELTLEEIADVHVKARTARGADQHRLEQCVAEVVWASAPVISQPRDRQVMRFVAGG